MQKTDENQPHSILLMAFGQSNADVHFAGPRSIPAPDDPEPVVTPNDGFGIRGLMGKARIRPITGFVPTLAADPKIQSLLAVAGARLWRDRARTGLTRVIVRSEARGARGFLGFSREDRVVEGIFRDHAGALSQIFHNLVTTIRQCRDAAAADGSPLRTIYILWFHGESDRSMSRADYGALFDAFLDTVAADLADLDVPLHWLVTQASGTGTGGGGNNWPNRMAVFDVADRRDDVDVVAAAYGYPLCDQAHLSAIGKIRLGEALGRIVALHAAGTPPRLPRIAAGTVVENRILLRFDTPAPLVIDRDRFTPPDDFDGFTASDRRHSTLAGVRIVADDTVELTLTAPPRMATLECSYAYLRNPKGSTPRASDYPVGRGCLRTAASTPSQVRPGEEIHDWVPGFILYGRDMRQGG